MKHSVDLGRVLFGVSMSALGVLSVIYGDGVFGLGPAPRWLPPPGWGYLNGLVLLASGVCLVSDRKPRLAATASGLVLGAWVLLQLPRLLAAPHDGGRWTTTAETIALCSAAWILTTALRARDVPEGASDSFRATAGRLGRFSYAASLFVFGIQHFIYHDYVASVIPAWIPGHTAWTYLIGLAFFAAGVSLAIGVWDRLAATLLGIMFGTWVLILHAPRAAAAPRHRPEWTSLFIALAMSGGAWIIAGMLEPKVRGSSPARDA
jgi:uncharacterized membrane protein YphA (DoxX/SURF4 family)